MYNTVHCIEVKQKRKYGQLEHQFGQLVIVTRLTSILSGSSYSNGCKSVFPQAQRIS